MYITLAEANAFLELSWKDTLVNIYISQAENILHSLCNVESFHDDSTTERHEYNANWPYYLKRHPRGNAITEINGVGVSYTEGTEYILSGRTILFANSVTLEAKSTERDYIEFTYTSWFETIPTDIKNAMFILVWWLQAKAKGVGLSSYSQGDISVSYSSTDETFGTSTNQKTIIDRIIGKYKFIDIYAV